MMKGTIKNLTKFVVFSICFVVLYSIFEFVFSIKYGFSHDTLTTCIYTFFGTEIASCGLIKIFKIKGQVMHYDE